MKRVFGDILSLITGNNEDDYQPSKPEWLYLTITIVMIGSPPLELPSIICPSIEPTKTSPKSTFLEDGDMVHYD